MAQNHFQQLDPIERWIATALIDAALASGHHINVWDGEACAIQRSTDRAAIIAELAATDSDTLEFWKDGRRTGWVWLVYGNGEDLITDYSDNAVTEKLVQAAEPVGVGA